MGGCQKNKVITGASRIGKRGGALCPKYHFRNPFFIKGFTCMTDVTAEDMAALCGLSSAAIASLTRSGIMQRGGRKGLA
jgi:hypothetical protein